VILKKFGSSIRWEEGIPSTNEELVKEDASKVIKEKDISWYYRNL